MLISDPVYGSYELKGVLEKVAASPTFQRLRRIRQGGAAFLAFPHLKTTRFEHSVGVAHLIGLLGGGVEEQVAGLLHDISHTAFSHVSDYLFQNQSEDFHELHKDRFIFQTEIAELLSSEGLDAHKIADEALWPRLESPLPNLCADRLDYTLRDYVQWANRPVVDVQKFLANLRFKNGLIAVTTVESARWFKEFFRELNEEYFAHPKNAQASLGLTDILRKALIQGILVEKDLFTDDEAILLKLSKTPLQHELDALKGQLRTDVLYEQTLPLKKRTVDPWVVCEDKTLKRLSAVNP